MQDFTNEWMPYINFIITIIVGVGLGVIIRHKNSLIKTLSSNFDSAKQLLELYDVNKFKDYTKMTEELLEMKHQKELKETVDKTIESAKNGVETKIMEISSPWILQYDELLNFHINFLIDMTESDREKYLSFLPKNREFIIKMITDIKSGKLKPDN